MSALLAEVSCVGNGELITCSTVKLWVKAEMEAKNEYRKKTLSGFKCSPSISVSGILHDTRRGLLRQGFRHIGSKQRDSQDESGPSPARRRRECRKPPVQLEP